VIDGACSFSNIDLLKLSRFDGLEKDWREKRGWMPIA
jgi:sarcosine oxidase subunit beta